MVIIFKSKTECPVCHTKTSAVKINSFLKVCPKCNSKVN